ncbi:hypothetical protein [Rhodovibrio salinarum]|nr:hypothetical protein [Rhodovibrio salinarum]
MTDGIRRSTRGAITLAMLLFLSPPASAGEVHRHLAAFIDNMAGYTAALQACEHRIEARSVQKAMQGRLRSIFGLRGEPLHYQLQRYQIQVSKYRHSYGRCPLDRGARNLNAAANAAEAWMAR